MKTFDFLIIGSGFSGSITAMALQNSFFSVCMIEKKIHPRFAIGESSTPIADMILRDLSDDYHLPFLKKLSRYGEWQKNYPEITCGLKRGFSYYHHKKGEKFSSDENHSHELLVAASENDENSDTNWLRSDVDHFLVTKAVDTGVEYFEKTEVSTLSRDPKNETWTINLKTSEETKEITCSWIIDASGSPEFAEKFFNIKSFADRFHTQSSAIYTHFEHVQPWSDYLADHHFNTSDYPYNPDFSALHHIIEEGWMWMLRFNNNRLSAGILLDESSFEQDLNRNPEKVWKGILSQYPSLEQLFYDARLANSPNTFFQSNRLQRRLNRLYGDGWLVLPHTAGFIDPLHSTGIAFTLSGVEYVLNMFSKEKTSEELLKNYQDKIFNELKFIDLLVSTCYQSRSNTELFTAATMLYFIASIQYEQSRLRGQIPETFLCADNPKLQKIIQQTFREISNLNVKALSKSESDSFVERMRKRIEPLNTVGLMNPDSKNMYWHTAVSLN